MNFGYWKFRVTRLQSYFTIIATVIQMVAAFRILGISYYWLTLAVPILYAIHWFDKNHVHPHESATMFADNLEWQEMRRKVNELHKSTLR